MKDNPSDSDRLNPQDAMLVVRRLNAVAEYRDLEFLPEFTWPWEQVLSDKAFRSGYQTWFAYMNVHELLQQVIFSAASSGKECGQAVRDFAGMTYAHCLLAQVYHYYFFIKHPTLPPPKPSILFPKIDGVLGCARVHVCPAILPAMLLYFNPSMLTPSSSGGYAPRYIGLEADTWQAHESLFDKHVDKVSKRIMGYIYHLCDLPDGWPSDSVMNKDKFEHDLVETYREEHSSLKAKVMRGSDEGRWVNGWGYAYPDARQYR